MARIIYDVARWRDDRDFLGYCGMAAEILIINISGWPGFPSIWRDGRDFWRFAATLTLLFVLPQDELGPSRNSTLNRDSSPPRADSATTADSADEDHRQLGQGLPPSRKVSKIAADPHSDDEEEIVTTEKREQTFIQESSAPSDFENENGDPKEISEFVAK